MTLWLWHDLGDDDGLTGRYHSGGSVLVSCDYWSDAVALLRAAAPHLKLTDDQLTQPITFHAGQHSGQDRVIIFPNAGCC